MSVRAGPAGDIEPRSLWRRNVDGVLVKVLDRAEGFVRAEGSPQHVWHGEFRRAHTALYDRPGARSQFSMYCANLAEFRMYWNPATGKLIARSLVCARAFRLPPDIVTVGVYCAPFSPEEFLRDLDSCIALHERTSARQAAAR